jgi:hypothetical protein
MAKITNLTFEQLNDESATPVFAYASGNVTVSLTALTGETYTGLTDPKVVKAVWKLMELGEKAQTTVNLTAADGDELAAFSAQGMGTFDPATYQLPLSRSLRAQIEADPTNLQGQ